VECHHAHAQKLGTHLEKYNIWLSRMEALLELEVQYEQEAVQAPTW